MYTYYNPRTKKGAVISSIEDEKKVLFLLEDLQNDILIVYSQTSCTIKCMKWHFEQYGGDTEYLEQLWEVTLPTLLGCAHTNVPVKELTYFDL